MIKKGKIEIQQILGSICEILVQGILEFRILDLYFQQIWCIKVLNVRRGYFIIILLIFWVLFIIQEGDKEELLDKRVEYFFLGLGISGVYSY